MTGGMNYRGVHRKYAEGSSEYVTYHYGDVVKRNTKFYVCDTDSTYGYVPEDVGSGFTLMSLTNDPSPNDLIDGGIY